MNLYLIRHGQTESNSQGRYLGSFDDELSLQGVNEIKKVREYIKTIHFDKVFSSERKRALDCAKILADKEIICEYRLNERDFGIFENKTYSEICDKHPLEKKAWEENWIDYRIPEGESVSEVYNRVVEFMRELEKENCENCLIVTHGGIIRLIYCYILGGDLNIFWKFASENGSISIVKFQYDNWFIDSIIQLNSMGSE
ncbi:phosphoserine phosphatase 1 [Clostridium homopropionicum DSM 5847]|uniref:Alpha-ribazole phosphatase n=1 Tax=Clostridium homopropionicum DSM 5847 TaxID=1121318 RepID=A0A0L6Z9X6_9CLOT|nr:alpha-ribazole phosphatase [Clostridium homopropionicum]KOA19770.1 phosphoserine phosphatase 1 [Clostridium homopropionicum DSM 5847]SFF77900.1 alpha-ribazole phosphatase [Clostridium homopropionicum]